MKGWRVFCLVSMGILSAYAVMLLKIHLISSKNGHKIYLINKSQVKKGDIRN
uniref:Uncharacterized protein n=1 Tax=Rhodnius prolixus TaxID=13249 RepID=T1HFK6_RHOPR